MTESKNKTTVFYNEWLDTTFKHLTYEQVGMLTIALISKCIDESYDPPEEIKTNLALTIAYEQLSTIVLLNKKKYDDRRATNKANRAKRNTNSVITASSYEPIILSDGTTF